MANAGANCFLSSELKAKLLAPSPTTERGFSQVVNFHPTENKIIYPSNKYIIIRNLDDPSDSFVYRGHANNTTVAKFSTNGFWVASADRSGKVRVWSWDNPVCMYYIISLDYQSLSVLYIYIVRVIY